MMYRLIRDFSLVLPLLTLAALLAIFSLSSPLGIGPVGVLAVFILFYLFFTSSFFIVLRFGGAIIVRLSQKRLKARAITGRRAYYIASVLAFGPVLLIALQSVGQLKIQDAALVVVLLALAIFYVARRS